MRLKHLHISGIRVKNVTKLQNMIENTSLLHLSLRLNTKTFGSSSKFFKILESIERNGSILKFSLNEKEKEKDGCEHKRNIGNLKKTRAVCETLLCVKQFRKTHLLELVGRDMTKLLSKFLYLTYPDAQTWTSPEDEDEEQTSKKRKVKI